ncbi:MAG: hypothetical protein MUF49_01725 [Oculatellaceae cyanobacterium Prado106]|jgi:hypothetical protein|nr:hypothetical protein [Oculatellaceae cyanobacterium Prado106]
MRVSTAAFYTLTALAASELTQQAIAATPPPASEAPLSPEEAIAQSLEVAPRPVVISTVTVEAIAPEPFMRPASLNPLAQVYRDTEQSLRSATEQESSEPFSSLAAESGRDSGSDGLAMMPDARLDARLDARPAISPDMVLEAVSVRIASVDGVLASDATPETASDTVSDLAPETPLEIVPETPPEVAPETPLEVAPETTLEIAPETTLEIDPATTLEIVPETPPEVAPDTTPDLSSEISLEVFPELALEITPEMISGISEMTSEMTSEINPEILPEITSVMTVEIPESAFEDGFEEWAIAHSPSNQAEFAMTASEANTSSRIASRLPLVRVLPEVPAPAPAELFAQSSLPDASPAEPTPNLGTPESPAPAPGDIPTDQEIEELQRQLDGVPDLQPEFGDSLGGAPAITISNPTGRGADDFTGFINASFQADKRYEDGADGSLGIGIGLGDSRETVGLQLSYTLASFGTLARDFGTGGFNAKLHRQFPGGLSVALGWEGFATIGDVDFEDTVYGVVTQIIRTTPDIDRPLSRIALTAGVGNGRFRSEEDVNNDVEGVNVFGSAAVRIARPVSVIVEWTGQDLAAGVSITPFRNFPLTITPALRDITGAGDGARFVIGTGISFKF